MKCIRSQHISFSTKSFLSFYSLTFLFYMKRNQQNHSALLDHQWHKANPNICPTLIVILQAKRRESKLGKQVDELWQGLLDCINELTEALVFSRMKDSAYMVETTHRLAQWRFENLASCTYRKSDPFKIGIWNWHLVVEKNRTLLIKLYPEISNLTRENPPIASFIIRLISCVAHRTTLVHSEVTDKQLKNIDDFVWTLEVPLTGKFIIDIEFLDLKISSPNIGEACSIWTEEARQKQSNAVALTSLGRMLTEGIHTDIVIHASNGSTGAHRAVLASRSPVFRSMFSHELKQKELSAINISDMSLEACQAFLYYIYGNIRNEDFLTHRLVLVQAADMYDVSDLKEACHESLLEDIDTKNVMERLQNAHLYKLDKLKMSCITYLVKFGKMFDIRDEIDVFLQSGDRGLIAEVFHEVFVSWKGF